MKIIETLIVIGFCGCLFGCFSNYTKPKLEEGSCYSVTIYDTSSVNYTHDLTSFRVYKIFDFKGQKHYALQILNGEGELLYPKSKSYGYVKVKEFDQYMAPIVSKWSQGAPEAHEIKCNEITDKEIEEAEKEPRLPFYRVGDDR